MRRGFVLIAVLVVIAAAIFVATGAIFAARAASVSARAADLERRLRDAALDGVALAADRLAAQRLALLQGGAPDGEELLTAVPDGPRQIEVRLVPQWDGRPFASESAKLDASVLDHAAIDALVDGAADVSRELLESVLARRPVDSVDALVALADGGDAGIDTEAALEAALGPARLLGDERDENDEGAGAAGASLAPPLIALMTAHGAEPLVDDLGVSRLDLVDAFNESAAGGAAEASLELFDDAEREALQALVKDRNRRKDDGAIVTALVGRGVGLGRVDEILNECTTEPGSHGIPRVDIVRADVRVLAAIEGIGTDAAARIVDLRDTLEDEERRGTSWLVSRRVLSLEDYAAVAGRITHRSALWRFRVESRIVASDERSAALEPEPASVYAFDCIVDVSRAEPRIAYLRDVALLPTARAIARLMRQASGEGERASAPTEAETSALTEEAVPEVADTMFRPTPGFRAPRFDLPTVDATIAAPPSRERTAPIGRDIAAPTSSLPSSSSPRR